MTEIRVQSESLPMKSWIMISTNDFFCETYSPESRFYLLYYFRQKTSQVGWEKVANTLALHSAYAIVTSIFAIIIWLYLMPSSFLCEVLFARLPMGRKFEYCLFSSLFICEVHLVFATWTKKTKYLKFVPKFLYSAKSSSSTIWRYKKSISFFLIRKKIKRNRIFTFFEIETFFQ